MTDRPARTTTSSQRPDPMVDRPYSSTWEQHTHLLRVHGAVDELSVRAFRDDLEEHVAVEAGTTVDLSDVDFFPSEAIAALVAAMKRAAGGGNSLDVVVAARTVPQRVLSICGLPHRVV